jgi:hypothetical protein
MEIANFHINVKTKEALYFYPEDTYAWKGLIAVQNLPYINL